MNALPDAGWADWLRSKKWDYWVTGTFARPAHEASALACAHRWLADAQQLREARYGAATPVYAVVAVERGDALGGVHVHMLVGGLGAHPALHGPLVRAWRYGHMLAVPYDPTKDPRGVPRGGASAYLTKHVEDVHIVGTLRKYRPRLRREHVSPRPPTDDMSER